MPETKGKSLEEIDRLFGDLHDDVPRVSAYEEEQKKNLEHVEEA